MIPVLLAAFLGCGAPQSDVQGADPAAAARPAAEQPAAVRAGEAHNAVVDPAGQGPEHWGAPFTLTNSEPLQTLVANPDPYVGKEVRVVGEVTTVCQKKGCWMVLRADGGDVVRVTMKDHAFGVRKDLAGATAHVQGTVVRKAVDPETVAHYRSESDGGDVPEEGRTEVIELVASAVEVAAL